VPPAPLQKKNSIVDLKGEFWCKLGAFSSPKAGLNAVPTVKITLGTPVPGVLAGNDPYRLLALNSC